MVRTKNRSSEVWDREWVSTTELATKFGMSVDYYQRLATRGDVKYERRGTGPRSRIMINLADFNRWRRECNGGAACETKFTFSRKTAPSGRARGARAKRTTGGWKQRIVASLGNEPQNG